MRTSLPRFVLALSFALLPLSALHAQTYPAKPIRVIVPFSAGGTSDIIARTLGQKLTEAWGQQTLVENRTGFAGNIGAAAAAKSPADGYTLLVGNVGPVAINLSIYKNAGYDPVKDFAPITLAVTSPQIVVVHPSVPAKTFQDFTALAVTGTKPTPLVSGVSTVAESGLPGFAATSWWGVLAPARTPEPIISRLNTELVRILNLADVKERFGELGVETITSTPAEFGSFIGTEIAKYSKLIAEVGIKPE